MLHFLHLQSQRWRVGFSHDTASILTSSHCLCSWTPVSRQEQEGEGTEERCRLGGAGEAGEGLRESQGVDSLQFRTSSPSFLPRSYRNKREHKWNCFPFSLDLRVHEHLQPAWTPRRHTHSLSCTSTGETEQDPIVLAPWVLCLPKDFSQRIS